MYGFISSKSTNLAGLSGSSMSVGLSDKQWPNNGMRVSLRLERIQLMWDATRVSSLNGPPNKLLIV